MLSQRPWLGALLVLSTLSSFAFACQRDAAPERQALQSGDAVLSDEVLSTVDGVPITRADLLALMRSSGMNADQALVALQDEILLGREATRRGYAETRAAREAAERALVQRFLQAHEETHDFHDAPPEILEASLAKQRALRNAVPQRRVRHVLVRAAEGDAPTEEAQATALLETLVSSRDRDADFNRFADDDALTVEDLPLSSATASFERPFLDAMFENDEVGLVEHLVRTSYGFHVIEVVEIVEAADADQAAIRADAEADVTNAARQIALGPLFAARQADVRYTDRLEEFLANPGFEIIDPGEER